MRIWHGKWPASYRGRTSNQEPLRALPGTGCACALRCICSASTTGAGRLQRWRFLVSFFRRRILHLVFFRAVTAAFPLFCPLSGTEQAQSVVSACDLVGWLGSIVGSLIQEPDLIPCDPEPGTVTSPARNRSNTRTFVRFLRLPGCAPGRFCW